jgi:hypothetical protein
MTQAELHSLLKSTGLPVAYSHFTGTTNNPVPKPPFITYQFSYSNDFQADNKNYLSISNFQVELYTIIKDLAAEKKLQDKLKEMNIPYSKLEEWIEEEKLFQNIYEIQLIGE